MKCEIIKDLLSNYIDGLTSEETNAEIRKHLDDCGDCHETYEKMSAIIPQEIVSDDKNIDFLKKLKRKIRRKTIIATASTCIVILTGFFIFAKNYDIPLPFDTNRMSVEIFTAAVITDKNGKISWQDKDKAISRGLITEDYDREMDLVRIAYKGINNISSCSRGRDINRNGENIRVIYFCYSKTLWDSLFIDGDLTGYSESGSFYGTDEYGDSFYSIDYEPQMREIYYLPIRNLHEIDNLSDEDFDNLKEKADLIWSGVI